MPLFPLLGSIMNECREFEKLVKVQCCLKVTVPKVTIDREQAITAVSIMNLEYNSASINNEENLSWTKYHLGEWFICLLFKEYFSVYSVYQNRWERDSLIPQYFSEMIQNKHSKVFLVRNFSWEFESGPLNRDIGLVKSRKGTRSLIGREILVLSLGIKDKSWFLMMCH